MDRQEIIDTIKKIGLRPGRAAGQHFLFDQSVVAAMVEVAEVTSRDTILEIGPGLGVLTEVLLETGAQVVAVELDQRLFNYLGQQYKQRKNLHLIHGDIFRVNLSEHVQDNQYKLVANLPYSATSLVFRNFLTLPPRPMSMTLMIQKEVAERVTAKPGQMSLLGLTTQLFSTPHYIMDVPRTSFWPAPAVTSAIIHATDVQQPDPELTKHLLRAAKAGFSGRRKQLHNSLASAFHQSSQGVHDALAKIGIESSQRAQDLTLKNWQAIAQTLVDES